MKKIAFCVVFLLSLISSGFAQNQILTAAAFFKTVSDSYGTIRDYEAVMDISVGRTSMSGRVSYKKPELLRIDFTNPRDQVIVYNGDMLTIYLPGSTATMNQAASGNRGANLATSQGLGLMSRYYSVSYETGPEPVPLEPDSGEMVIRLLLSRKNMSEEFRTIKLSIDPVSLLIRRVDAAARSEVFVFSFSGYRLNQGIPDQRFIYDPPASANDYNNFLFAE
ncbi:MAG: outer-membrane lipoprotein carrier protein LolA [Treponema sp.]|jgi:outer membrane lipoprotein-sorting protein|nr:outer-membrane lipoprotein carrier protein LolA [Treponema sp.]